MNGRNSVLVIIFFLLIGVVVFYMMFKVRDVDDSYTELKRMEHTDELTAALNELDYHIYWIGELPEYMEGISDHVTVLQAGAANSSSLPVAEGSIGFTNYDEDGNVLEHIEQRDYAPYMMIVVNTSDDLPEVALSAIQDSSVDNHVPVLVIGRNNIDAFREYMILVHKDYDENASLYFEITRYPLDNPIDPGIVSDGGREYADALLEFIRGALLDPAVVAVTDIPAADNTEQTDIETVEETADAA